MTNSCALTLINYHKPGLHIPWTPGQRWTLPVKNMFDWEKESQNMKAVR